MSLTRATAPPERRPQACADCLRRTWLVARLAGRIELARHAGRGAGAGALRELLALPDATLLAAIAGQERRRIARELERVEPAGMLLACARAGLAAVCRHDPDYPARLLRPRRRAGRLARDRSRCRPAGAAGRRHARRGTRRGRHRRHAACVGGRAGGRAGARARAGGGRRHGGQRHGAGGRQRRARRCARRRRGHGRGAGLRRRCALPAQQARAVRPHRAGRVRRVRAAARLRPAPLVLSRRATGSSRRSPR